jgi:DNA-binding NarL/FixJ family response regulator
VPSQIQSSAESLNAAGIEGARRVLAAAPDVKVVVLTTFDEDDYVEAALCDGVSGFLLKVAPPNGEVSDR